MSKLSKDAQSVVATYPTLPVLTAFNTLDTIAKMLGWDRERTQAALRELAIR